MIEDGVAHAIRRYALSGSRRWGSAVRGWNAVTH